MSVKYQILFKDKRNNDCSVRFDFADYSGTDVITLTGAASPATITYDGDQDDIFQPIISSKANIQVLINQKTQQFVQDVRDIDDRQVAVTITYGKNKKWIGNLISDQNYEKFDVTGYFMSLTCVDPFSYLKQNGKQILSTSNMYGFQTVFDFVQAVINESWNGIPIEIINDYTPSVKNCYFYTDTLMENGVYPDGYTMMQKLMTSLCMTAIITNGVLYLINNRSNIGNSQKEIGIKPLGATDYLLSNSEIITRTRGAKRCSAEYSYPPLTNYLKNGSFYFFDSTKSAGSEFTEWSYDPALLTDGGIITRVGNGEDNLPYGVRFQGEWGTEDKNTAGLSTQFVYNTNDFDYDPSSAGTPFLGLSLDIDYTYKAYEIDDSNRLQYTLSISAQLASGGTKYYLDNNEAWEVSPDDSSRPYNYFKIGSTPQRQTNTVDIKCFLSSTTGALPISWAAQDIIITVSIYGLMPEAQTDYIHSNPLVDIDYDITINKVSIYQRNIKSISSNDGDIANFIYLYSKDNTDITNRRNYSLVNDPISIALGEKFYLENDLSPNFFTQRNDSGILMNADNTPITEYSFRSDFTVDKLVTLIAKDRMFFGRQPRYKVDCEIESDDLDMSNTIKFTHGEDELLPNTYTILSDELDVRMCKHHVLVQELTGSDDDTDTIQNYLGTN